MITARILKLKNVLWDKPDLTYHKQYKINYDSWDKLLIKDRLTVLDQLIQTDNNIKSDYSKTKYNLLPYDLKAELDKIKIEVY